MCPCIGIKSQSQQTFRAKLESARKAIYRQMSVRDSQMKLELVAIIVVNKKPMFLREA